MTDRLAAILAERHALVATAERRALKARNQASGQGEGPGASPSVPL